MTLTALIILAICTEAVISCIKDAVTGGFKWQIAASLIIGCVIAIAYNADLLATQGIVSNIPFIGNILTGIAIGRGSNFFFDLIKKLQSTRQ